MLLRFDEFANYMAKRESGDNYQIKNKFGYLGRYQFGMARLCDLGLTKRKPGRTGMSNDNFEWVSPYSEFRFLHSPDLQDATFKRHIADLRDRLYPLLSGLVAGAHLVGIRELYNLLYKGKVAVDGLGTPITEYIEKFAGYELQELGPDNSSPESLIN